MNYQPPPVGSLITFRIKGTISNVFDRDPIDANAQLTKDTITPNALLVVLAVRGDNIQLLLPCTKTGWVALRGREYDTVALPQPPPPPPT